MTATGDPGTGSWLKIPQDSEFGLDNLPYGIFRIGQASGVCVAVGDQVLDLSGILEQEMFASSSLNAFLAAGPRAWRETRAEVTDVLTDVRHLDRATPHLYARDAVEMRLPFEVGDFVDFYSFRRHAENLGRMFRPGEPPLPENWLHLPVGYHGRSGTVVVSGTPIVRPNGQRQLVESSAPSFGPTKRLDLEAEIGFVVGVSSTPGIAVATAEFHEHVFGALLVNDWSARDIQAWEYRPLGPFLGKSFATSISPWVVPLAALGGAIAPAPTQDPEPVSYLRVAEPRGLDIRMEVALNGHVISRPQVRDMYWSPAQQLAHLTVNGAHIRTGDLFASGTVSGADRQTWGSLIELARNGADPVRLANGETRTYLEDGDRVVIRAWAPGPSGSRIGFGEVEGTVHSAITASSSG
jgi:fumarylacetoacetase